MENIPLADNITDMVFSSLTFQWCNDLDRVFTESCRVLTASGPLVFTMLGPDTLKELRASWAKADENRHVNDFIDMHDVGDALGRAGFHEIVMDVETITLEYPDCIQIMQELKRVGAQNVNTSRQKTLTGKDKLERMTAAYEKFRRNGMLPVTYEVVYGLAWKPVTGTARQAGGISYVPIGNIRKYR